MRYTILNIDVQNTLPSDGVTKYGDDFMKNQGMLVVQQVLRKEKISGHF